MAKAIVGKRRRRRIAATVEQSLAPLLSLHAAAAKSCCSCPLTLSCSPVAGSFVVGVVRRSFLSGFPPQGDCGRRKLVKIKGAVKDGSEFFNANV